MTQVVLEQVGRLAAAGVMAYATWLLFWAWRIRDHHRPYLFGAGLGLVATVGWLASFVVEFVS